MNYNSFNDYLEALPPDTIFRLWEYKRMFTPYEVARKSEDESEYKNEECYFVCIKDTITLPDGDILLATYDCSGNDDSISYYKLSNVEIAKCKNDMEEE